MRKSLKIFYVLFIAVYLIFALQNVALAGPNMQTTDGGGGGGSNWASSMLGDAEGWGATDDGGLADTTQTVVGTIIDIIQIVGAGIAIIMTTYVAIKYMSAAPSEKADFKKSATGLIVGAVVLFAASGILTIIANFAEKNINGG